ncbi:hypothetical protein [Frankia sp. AiPa1]|uniref:hypothetical protein n=1 Tax=Frankia sp. AiPa1 TaxID=573492 RepID=UPI00202B61FF|nr:hypothetical protein [Frankia sp. AiPa1]
MPGQAPPAPSAVLVPAVRHRYLNRADPADSDAWPVGFSPTGEALPETLTDVLLRGSHAIRSSKRAEAQRLERAAAVANHVDAQIRDFLDFCAAENLVPPVTVRACAARPRRSVRHGPGAGADRPLPGVDAPFPGADHAFPGADHPLPGSDHRFPGADHPFTEPHLLARTATRIDWPGERGGTDGPRRLDDLHRFDDLHRPDARHRIRVDDQHRRLAGRGEAEGDGAGEELGELEPDVAFEPDGETGPDLAFGPDGETGRHGNSRRRGDAEHRGGRRHHDESRHHGGEEPHRRHRPRRRERLQAWPLLYWRCESFPAAGRSLHLFVEPNGRTFEGRDDPAPLTVLGREVRVWPVDAAAIVAGMAEVDARRCALQLVHGMAHLLWRAGVGL